MYTSLIFDINVAGSITGQARALISSASMMFESFFANSVKFGSLDQVLLFIRNVCKEERQYDDYKLLSHFATVEETFIKIIMSCGYRWIPNDEEMDLIWKVISNLGQIDLNRVYYKNNLYEFLSNDSMKEAIKIIMRKLEMPFFNSLKVPPEIKPELTEFANILKEYVYYDKMIIDRTDRNANMIKEVIMISDTDSCIVSLDAWYRFALDVVKDEDLTVTKHDPIDVLKFYDMDEDGDFEDLYQINPLRFQVPEEHYDFMTDEKIMEYHAHNPFIVLPQDYLRYSIINVMAFVIDVLINDYMEKFTKNNNSWSPDKKCVILMKNEFTFLSVLMTMGKKHYASYQGIQEGNRIPKGEMMDIKGIDALIKSSTNRNTQKVLKNILEEDILATDKIDQFRIIERLAILEHDIVDSIQKGSKDFYKPATIKSVAAYSNPMRIQGIKASVAWNSLREEGEPAIDLDTRNAINIAKVNINKTTLEKIKDSHPEVYAKALKLLDSDYFKGEIESVAVPLDVEPPKWMIDMIDYKTIVIDNMKGFVYDSVGLVRLPASPYTNILQL